MIIQRIPTASGIDDIKLIGQTDAEKAFVRQLAEAGTLSCMNRSVGDSVLFRAISTTGAAGPSSYTSDIQLAKYNFTVTQNKDWIRTLSFSKPVSGPTDLTVYSQIKLQVKNRKGGSVIFEVSLGSGLQILGDDNNMLEITFTNAQTKLLCHDEYYYDILMVQGGINDYYVEGKIKVKLTGTR